MTIAEAREKILKMSDEEKAKYHLFTCPRCGGSGRYSYCTMYGDTCFKCHGVGYIKDYKKQEGKQ